MSDESHTTDERVERPDEVTVVALGASAGALQAIGDLLATVPADARLAFVVVHHVDPDHESLMAQLLSRRTAMSVAPVKDGVRLEPDHVYVIPPNCFLALEGSALRLSAPDAPRGLRLPIDRFLVSLAQERGPRAVAVILSGTGADGSVGIASVAERGGLVLAQDPDEAEHAGMPRSAIATGRVDHVLPIAQMAQIIEQFARRPRDVDLAKRPGTRAAEERVRPALAEIVELLATRSAIDFDLYKEGTLLRRIDRRMAHHHLENAHDYLALVSDSEEELGYLVNDLLINVTSFFRDPEAFADLADRTTVELLPDIAPGHPLRVWVPACSTGEEAYTLAMVLSEAIEASRHDVRLQIFASDIDEHALVKARAGVYPESIGTKVPTALLERWFLREDHVYRVVPELRERIVFAHHNVLADAPFSRLHLVSCRNLLIYFDARGRQRALDLFHFALREGGLLLLGSAESVSEEEGLFQRVAGAHRLFRRGSGRQHRRLEIAHATHVVERGTTAGGVAAGGGAARLAELARELLAARYAPAAALVDASLNVLFTHGASDAYLRVAVGAASQDLAAMYRGEAPVSLGGAVRTALRESRDVTLHDSVERDGVGTEIIATVHPVPDRNGLALIAFAEPGTEQGLPGSGSAGDGANDDESGDAAVRRRLEAELDATREDLRRTVQEFERSSEELRAANEETMSLNEEFRSTNEELETSKEELQSLNEELTTLNTQLGLKVDEERRVSDDLDNLLSSSGVATLFLDRERRIVRFTPTARSLFSVIATDIGRPLVDIASRVDDPGFDDDTRAVLGGAAPREREVRTREDRWLVRRVLPYRTRADGIGGLVVTYQDVTELKRLERTSAIARRFAQGIVDTVREPMLVLDGQLRVLEANRSWYDRFDTAYDDVAGVELSALSPDWARADLSSHLRAVLAGEPPVESIEIELDTPADGRRTLMLDVRLIVSSADGEPRLLLALEDVSDELARREALARAQRMEAVGQLTSGIAHDFNNLLTVVGGNLELLAAELDDDTQRELLGEAREAAELGAQLTARLLAFSRRQMLEPRPVDLNALVLAMQPLLERALGDTVHVTTALCDELPSTLADPGQIENVLMNLALNAGHAMPAGGTLCIGTRTVSIGDDKATTPDLGENTQLARPVPGTYVALSVDDTGTGMSDEVRARAFEPFFTTHRESGGSGLGLSMVYGFAQQSGGHVEIDTASDRGTTVTLYLPPAPPASSADADPRTTTEQDELLATGDEKVLLVEDDARVRRVTLEVLRRLGYTAIPAVDGATAVAALAAHPDCSLVLCDILLPGGMTGFDVADHAAGLDPAPKVLLMSGYADDPGAAVGERSVLKKPYRIDELARALRAQLDT